MENKLDVLTKKLYDEGVQKANKEAKSIIEKAKKQAEKLISDANSEADTIKETAKKDSENLKRKAESEMALSSRQALTALKQSITELISGKVSSSIAKDGFKEMDFVQEMLVSIIKKWDISSGNLDLNLILSKDEKSKFEKFVSSKYKELLDKGLEVSVGDNVKGVFIIKPKDGSYQITFSEKMFDSFFNQYMRSFTKKLLYNE